MGLDGKRVWPIAGGAFHQRGNNNNLSPGDIPTVTSVFGRSGVVTAQANDYLASLIQNDSLVPTVGVAAALNYLIDFWAPTGTRLWSGRDPILDRPTTATPDDDEFAVDPLNPMSTWTLAAEGSTTPFTRDGAIDLTQNLAASHFRSQVLGGGVRNGILLIQVPVGQACVMYKALAGALTKHCLWTVGMGCPFEGGTGVANNPKFGVGMWRTIAGAPDYNNRAVARITSNPDIYNLLTLTGGATISNLSSGTYAPAPQLAGIGLRINHNSAAANNAGAAIYSPRGAVAAIAGGQSVQFNAATDKVGLYMQSNVANAIAGTSTLFALHYFRRIDLSDGKWIAQD